MVARIHGMEGTSEYRTWIDMKRRCHQPQRPDYKRYGARGIYVCDRWRFGEDGINGFVLFLRDMGPRPSPAHTIDRKDNDGPYSPDNCEWTTKIKQGRNIRTNVFIEFRGKTVTLKEAAEMAGINYQTLFSRIHLRGWSVNQAFAKPILSKGFTLTGKRPRK